MRVRTEGAYIIKAAEGRPQRVPAKAPPLGFTAEEFASNQRMLLSLAFCYIDHAVSLDERLRFTAGRAYQSLLDDVSDKAFLTH